MKTKHIAHSIILNVLLLSATCSGMEYMHNTYNATKTYAIFARLWTTSFFKSCWNVGIIPTLYLTAGMYDFKKMSGLDENKLDTYNIDELHNAWKRVNELNSYGIKPSALNALNRISTMIQGKEQQKQHDAEVAAQEAMPRNEAYDKEVMEQISKILNK
ncbi:MAG TPA: hypothetical protein VHX42_01935 [Candidatus Babeliales bacterium]|jgi:hypothetical protein|nr:hypothetical protein [Candidatus Babeliales bacterium]